MLSVSSGRDLLHQTQNIYSKICWYVHKVVQWVESWTCDQQAMGSNPTRGKNCITTLGKLFTPMYLCHQAVYLGTGQGVVIR